MMQGTLSNASSSSGYPIFICLVISAICIPASWFGIRNQRIYFKNGWIYRKQNPIEYYFTLTICLAIGLAAIASFFFLVFNA